MNPDEKSKTYEEPIEEINAADHPWQTGFVATSKPKRSFGQKLKALLKSRKFWLLIAATLLAAGIALWFVPTTRLWLVNLFGARNALTITTISPGEGKAKVSQLRNVAVTVNGKSYKTDDKGQLRVDNVPYGNVTIIAKKIGFQDINYGVTLDLDPFLHKLGGQATDQAARNIELSMKSTGIPVSFKLVNWLSGKPVTTGDFAIGDVVAKPDDQGLVSLRIPGTDASKVTVNTSFGGAYVDQKFDVTLGSSTVLPITVVPGGRHYFVSKRSGALAVYSSNLDGSDVQLIVSGTGKETDSTAFATSPDGKYGIFSSSRDGAINAKRDTLQRVYAVNLATKQLTRVDEGVNVTFADWSGNTLIYTVTAYDATTNTYPTTLRSVDASSGRLYNFETSDYISVSTVTSDKVLFLRYTSSGPDAASSPRLREAPVNATSVKTLGDQVGYDSYQQLDFDRVTFKTGVDQAWHEYNLNTDLLKNVQQPSSGSSSIVRYLSAASSDNGKQLLIDRMDGKYTLFVKDVSTGAQNMVYGDGGLGGPIRWIGNVIVFRVVNAQETADYAISLDGGKPRKITDVTAAASTQGSVTDQRFRFY